MTDRTLPEGFILKSVTTDAAGFRYTVEVPQGESLEAFKAAYKADGKNAEEIILANLNASQEQGGKQGQKTPVRKAVEALEADPENPELIKARDDAVAKHQGSCKGFLIGMPRGGGGAKHESGMTQKQRTELGTEFAMEMVSTGAPPTKARTLEICEKLGIDPAALKKS